MSSILRAANNRRTFLRGIEPEHKIGQKGVFNTDFEEPTYLTFRLHFGSMVNSGSFIDGLCSLVAPQNNSGTMGNYESMPTPFFQLKGPERAVQEATALNTGDIRGQNFVYSAYEYLFNSNQAHRAELLLEFIHGWSELQYQYQYFFTKVEGISEALKINPASGIRLKDGTKLKITVRDSLDQRVRYLLSLYRRIVWDDDFQRWTMPDMMRFFRVYVFVSEIRTFHKATTEYTQNNTTPSGAKTISDSINNSLKNYTERTLTTVKNEANRAVNTLISHIPELGIPAIDDYIDSKTGRGNVNGLSGSIGSTNEYDISSIMGLADFVYKTVNDIAPVTLYEFDMCDIDVDSLNSIVNNSYANESPEESGNFTFSVNVRQLNVVEKYNILKDVGRWPGAEALSYIKTGTDIPLDFPTNLNLYINDFLINKLNRNLQPVGYDSDNSGLTASALSEYKTYLDDTALMNDSYFMGEHELVHIPGVAYHKNDLTTGIDPTKTGKKIAANSLLMSLTESAIKSVFGMGVNAVTRTKDNILNTKIGSTNLSVNDIFGVLRTGNIASLGKAVSIAVAGLADPTGNSVGLRSNDPYKTVIAGMLANLASKVPLNDVDLKNVLTARELLAPGNKTLFEDLVTNKPDPSVIDMELDKLYRESFDKYHEYLDGKRDSLSKENQLIDNAIYDAKFEFAKLIVTEKNKIDLTELQFQSADPYHLILELDLNEADKKTLILTGLNQDTIKLSELPDIELKGLDKNKLKPELQLILAGINKPELNGPDQIAEKNELELDRLNQDTVKNNIELDPLNQDTFKNEPELYGLDQEVEKNEIELTGLNQSVSKTKQEINTDLVGSLKKNDIDLNGPSQEGSKREIELNGLDQRTNEDNRSGVPNLESSIYRTNTELEMFKDNNEKVNPQNLGLSGDSNKNTIQLQGPFYSVEPNRDFLKGKTVQVHPDNPAKSKLIDKKAGQVGTTKEEKSESELNEIRKKNIYNQR